MRIRLSTHSDSVLPCVVLLLLMSITVNAMAVPFLSHNTLPAVGFVYKQGRVLDSQGFPIYAEYDSDPDSLTSGEVIRTIPDLDGSDETLSITSRAQFKATSDALKKWKEALPPGFYDKLKIIARDDFTISDYPSAYKDMGTSYPSSRSLLVYKPEALDGTVSITKEDGLIVQQSVFSIEALLNQAGFGGDKGSLVINDKGEVVYPPSPAQANENTIGFKVAYFNPTDNVEDPERSDTDIYERWSNNELEEVDIDGEMVREAFIKPLESISVTTGVNWTATDQNGYFVYYYPNQFCMGDQIPQNGTLSAYIPYRKLNPQKISTGFHHYVTNAFFNACWGIPTYPPTDLTSAIVTTQAIDNFAATATPKTIPQNFPVDVTEIDGTFTLNNVALSVETKRVDLDEEERFYALPENPDFNVDGDTDEHLSALGSIPWPDGAPEDAAPLFGVWFSLPEEHEIREKDLPYDADGEPIAPDLVRVATQKQSFEDIGLLETISKEDLVKTDIYVFRESTGQLVMEKSPFYVVAKDKNGKDVEGPNKYSAPLNGILDLDDDPDGRGYFGVTIPGRDANRSVGAQIYGKVNKAASSVESYKAWQQTRFVEEDFRGEVDSLREGEPLRVVLINRATGYIGTIESNIEIKDINPNGSLTQWDRYGIGLGLGDIKLYPPNLKVNVTRRYEVKQGLTKGDARDYRVGSEGAALHSDEYILVNTEWRDQDGSPLPSQLPGYTGRLTSLSGDKALADNEVGHFEVKPGLHTEYIKLSNESSSIGETGYQYIHIVAEQLTEAPDFSSLDATNNRPEKYVPFKVAVYDEDASRALKAAQLENPDNTLEQDSSVYQWPYRPEMMYSVFDLDVTEILRTPTGDDGEAGDPIDITGSETPTITAGDAELTVVQDLIASEYDPLDFFGPDSHLVYSLEGYQAQVNPGEDTAYTYTDFGHLGEMEGDDFLTLNLINSQDAGNVLWEWAFEYLTLSLANDEELFVKNRVYLNADNASIELAATLIGYANRQDNSEPVALDWKIEKGQATVTPKSRVFPENGVIKATVEPTALVENVVVVSAYLRESPEVKVASIEIAIQAGEVLSIAQQSSEGTAYVRGKGAKTITVSLKDKHGNAVRDGTPVDVKVAGAARLVEVQSATVDGQASFSVKGTVASGEVNVSVYSNGVEVQYPVTIEPLISQVTGMPVNFVPGVRYQGVVEVTNASGSPQSDVPIELYAVGADVKLNGFKTDENGQITFEAMVNEFSAVSQVTIDARADKQSIAQQAVSVGNPEDGTKMQFAVSPVGTNAQSVLVAELGDGDQCTIDLSEAAITLTGTPLSEVPLISASESYPNLLPTFSTDIYSGEVVSANHYTVTTTQVYTDSDTPQLQGFSARFGENGEWKVEADASLRIDQPAMSFWIKTTAGSSSGSQRILSLGGNTLVLSRQADSTLQLSLTTDNGPLDLLSSQSLGSGWHRIALGYNGEHYYLVVDNQKASLPSGSALLYTSSSASLELGGDQGMKLSHLQLSNNAQAQLVELQLGGTHFDTNGQVQALFSRSASLLESSYRFSGQRIEWRYEGGRLALLLLEDEQLASYASLYNKQTASPCTPLNLVKLTGATGEQVPLVRSIAKRHAEIKVADASAFVALAKSGLRWIEHHPENRGTAAAMRRLQTYLVSPQHDVLAGAMDDELSSAINEWKGGSQYRLLTLLTGLQVWSEMIDASPLAADLLVSNIQSSTDFWTWMRYLSLPGKGWAGGVIPLPQPDQTCDNWQATVNAGTDYAYNPKPCRVSGQVAGDSIVAIYVADPNDADNITPLLASTISGFRDAPFLLTKMIFGAEEGNTASLFTFDLIRSAHATPPGKAAKGFNAMLKHVLKQMREKGPDNIIGLLKNETNARFSAAELFGAMFYLASRSEGNELCNAESGCKRFNADERAAIEKNIKNNIKRFILGIGLADKGEIFDHPDQARKSCVISRQAHGAGMELVLTAMYHLLYERGLDEYEILAGDKWIDVPYVVGKDSTGKLITSTTGRVPDLILEGEGDESRKWIEAKSWAQGSSDKATLKNPEKRWEWQGNYKNVGKYIPGHRQYILDSIAVDRTKELGELWKNDIDKKKVQFPFAPKKHKTWLQVWEQENRVFHYKEKSGTGYVDKTNNIHMSRSWVDLKDGKRLTAIGDDFPVLQKYFSTLPDGWGEEDLKHTVGSSSTDYAEKLKNENFNGSEGRLDGVVAPFTLGRGLITEVGEGVKDGVIATFKEQLGNHSLFGELDMDEVTAAQRAALEEYVLGNARDSLESFSAIFDGIEYIDEKVGVAVEKVLDIIAYLGGEEVADGIEEARRANKEISEAMEGIVADMIRNGEAAEYISLPFSDALCEQVE